MPVGRALTNSPRLYMYVCVLVCMLVCVRLCVCLCVGVCGFVFVGVCCVSLRLLVYVYVCVSMVVATIHST